MMGQTTDGDSATTRLRNAETRANVRYGRTLQHMVLRTGLSTGLSNLPHYHVRERLRKWRDEWLRAMRDERDLLLMGRHPRQFEFYRDGKPRQS